VKQGTNTVGSRKFGGNRIQLFSASPLENKPGRPDVFSLASPNSSLDSPSLLEWTNKKAGAPGPRKGAQNRISPQHDWQQKGQQKHSPNYVTPDRFKYKQTLGDFLATTDSSDYNKKKKSPHWSKKETHDGSPTPSPSMRRRSGSKGKKSGAGSSESATRVMKVTPVPSPPPIFSLNNLEDFPPVNLGSVSLKEIPKSSNTRLVNEEVDKH
jgi:hypothetical protein